MLPAVFKGDLHAISHNMLYLVTFKHDTKTFFLVLDCNLYEFLSEEQG